MALQVLKMSCKLKTINPSLQTRGRRKVILTAMKRIVLLFLHISLCTTAYNQVISGRILDKDTKKPIDFATAYFAGTFTGTNTDKDGNFELDISKNKSMPLTISALGYYSVNITDLLPGKKLMIYLAPKNYELNEIVIRAGNIKDRKSVV
jgi:hypothetical protein